ncbi:MAG TPA: diguanylate cyclase [Polyangia bacterium]|nr:diguanylate cyclase [Polyangia bacterium]
MAASGGWLALGLGLLLAAIALAIAVTMRRDRTRVARIQGLVRYVEGLAERPGADALTPDPAGAFGDLESALDRLGRVLAERERHLRAAESRQQRDAQIQRALTMATGEADVMSIAAQAIADAAPSVPAEILLAEAADAQMHLAAISASGLLPGCPVTSPSSCPTVSRGQTLRFGSSEALDACPRLRGRPDGACSAVCVPVSVMGQAIGVLHATAPVEAPLTNEVVGVLESIATHVGSRLGTLHTLEKFQLQAATDPLTGLDNRRSLGDSARTALRPHQPAAVVICDLDHFKQLNDQWGHETGDRALQLFAGTLRASLRPSDVVARLGGEEFALILPRCTADQAAVAIGRLQEALSKALDRSELPRFTVSYGVAGFPEHGERLEDLLRIADRALYKSKHGGRNRITIATRVPATRVALTLV